MTALKTYNSSRTGIGHFFVANPTSFLHYTFHKFYTFSPFFSSWVKLIFPTNKQFTLITTVPSVLDFEFLFGSVLFAGPESRTQCHFLHLTPLSLSYDSAAVNPASPSTFHSKSSQYTWLPHQWDCSLHRIPSSPLHDKSKTRTGQDVSLSASNTASTPFSMILFSIARSRPAKLPAMRSSCSFGNAFFCSTVRKCLHPSASRHIPLITSRRSSGERPLSSPLSRPSSMLVV